MRQTITCMIDPIGKPRMTRRDKWAKRDCVLRYRAFADLMRIYFVKIDLSKVRKLSWIAFIAMPENWSKKKKLEMAMEPHLSKPDRDNIDKAILDALFESDSQIYAGSIAKYWDDGFGARLEIMVES